MAKVSYATNGPCFRRNCMNVQVRCNTGYCPSCCRAFHDHVGPTAHNPSTIGAIIAAVNPSQSMRPNPNPVLISTAIQPNTPPQPPAPYEPGVVRLVCEQDIRALNGLTPRR